MKNSSLKFILRYIATIVLVVSIVIALNYGSIIYFTRYSSYIKEPTKLVEDIAKELSENKNELSDKTSEIIKNNDIWVQLISPSGEVIYSNNKPKDIGNYYSIKDIAVLSKSYLNDYPVFLWESDKNLVILGYPKNSIEKYNFFIPSNFKDSKLTSFLYIILLNIGVTVILSIVLVKVLNKPLTKLIKAVFSLKEEKEVSLNEKGIYKDLAKSINETSKIIIDKNNKIKLKNNAIEGWIASISHDVRTPLSMVLGYSAMIEEDNEMSKETREQAKIITENSIRIKELVTNLNLATSLQYNMQPLKIEELRVGDLVREAIANCINSNVIKSSSIDIFIEDEGATILADKDLILRSIINLIINSVNHNKEGCNITVTVPKVDKDHYAIIIISDNGCGISEEKINKINNENTFYNKEKKNHGLGLIIVKSILEAHNGSFLIENGKEKGAVVTLKIPQKRDNYA
jgi:signal transduction histidine kinase